MSVSTYRTGVVLTALVGVASVVSSGPAHAVPLVLDPSASLSVFDTGGALNTGTVGGLEVDPAGGTVFVMSANAGVGSNSSTLQMIRSSGLGTSSLVGAAATGFRLNTRGYDLTAGPAGLYYVAGTLNPAAGGPDGIFGFDPAGVAAPVPFASTTGGWATSGLTFDSTGTTALVSTDGVGSGAVVLANGLYSVAVGGPEIAIISSAPLPAGIPAGTDDHVITNDGRTIVVGDGSHDLWDVSGGAGSVSLLVDLDTLALGTLLGVGGVRATVDPISGDIFLAWGLESTGSIVRVRSDGSGAIGFATSFGFVRDIDFGLSSDGSGDFSLYVSEELGVVGTIYEMRIARVPEPASLALLGIGLAGLGFARKKKAH